ncbi:sugar nucleotide-binding protein [bacterium]|nr:sugar nucleotide-binding protein [bacterium]
MNVVLGNGLLGSEIVNQTGWDCISRKDGFDATQPDFSLLSKYDIIINCIANTDSYSDDIDSMMDVNYKFVMALSDYCRLNNKKLVHISTEFVYANNYVIPTELDPAIPDNTWYAQSKLLADQYIELTNTNYLICRETHKPNPFPYPKVWDVMTCGDTVDKIANLIIRLVNKEATGMFNVGTGPKRLWVLAPNAEIIDAPKHVPKDTRMNLNKLNSFL